MDATTIPEALLDRLRSGGSFLVTSHLNPDGDAVGTSIGLARMLRRTGASARVWLHDPVPDLYLPAAEGESVVIGVDEPEGFPQWFDSAIVLECPTLDRCGLESSLSQLPLINIDHHLGNAHYGVVDWVDSNAPAVGEMVLRLAIALGLELDASVANPLFMALATDTGGFRFANATERAFSAGAEMVRQGAHPEEVSRWLYESRSAAAVCMIGEVLATLRLSANGRVASVAVTEAMLERCGAKRSDTEGLIDYPRSIHGVETVALVRELPEGGHKVSVRSRGDIDVESVARSHGGGGHKNAAGFNSADDDLEGVREMVVAELAALLED